MNSVAPPIATQATPVGRGSICTLLLDGHDIVSRIETMFRPASPGSIQSPSSTPVGALPTGNIRFGHWNHQPMQLQTEQPYDTNSGSWEEVVLAISTHPPGPSGAPATTRIELQCHGGDRAANSILKSLESVGFLVLPWRDWLARTKSTFACEHSESLAAATTQRTALLLLAQGQQASGEPGSIEREINRITVLLGESNQDEPNPSKATGHRLRTLINNANVGRHLTVPWQIAVVGEPNVGKSSLVNALVGFQRAIVYDQPGTTRDELETSMALDGWPMKVWDTAGLRETADAIESQGIARAFERLKQSDLILHIRDARVAFETEQEYDEGNSLRDILDLMNKHSNVLTVRNKIDLLPVADKKAASSRGTNANNVIQTSATVGTGLDELKRRIVQALIPTKTLDGKSLDSQTALLFTQRQISLAEDALALFTSGQLVEAADRLASILR